MPEFWVELFGEDVKVKPSEIRDLLEAKKVDNKEITSCFATYCRWHPAPYFQNNIHSRRSKNGCRRASISQHPWGCQSFLLKMSCIKGRET